MKELINGKILNLKIILVTVLIGTIYPIFLEVIKDTKISVGPPFYNFVIIPFMIPFLLFMSFGPKLNWIKTKIFTFKKDFIFLVIIICVVMTIIYYSVITSLTSGI